MKTTGMRPLLLFLLAVVLLAPAMGGAALAADANVISDYSPGGSIYSAERNPDQGDRSQWLTIQAGETGIRVVSKDGVELIAVDNFGGIYLNGDVYLNQKLLETGSNQLANGFLYLLLVISLALNLWSVCKIKKISGKRGGA